MDIRSFIEGPLLEFVFFIFFLGIILRFIFFLIATFANGNSKSKSKYKIYNSANIIKLFVPLHKAIGKKPFYSILRYVFHLCMILTPVFLAGHVALLSDSFLRLSWPALPGIVADILTIAFILLNIIFLLRRIILRHVRERSAVFDYIFLVICLLPFLSGYFLVHGTLNSIGFFSDNLLYIHILCSCLMILTAVFLFAGTRLDVKSCVGCASCEINCPTGTLETENRGMQKIFNYSQYKCITCGSCVYVCPENAAELRHAFGISKFFKILGKQMIRAVDLKKCLKCGTLFAPEPQIAKLGKTINKDYYQLCPDCKIANLAEINPNQIPV
jgi:ferredoxin